MRLSPFDRAAILESVAEVAGPHARVKLFGSRTRDDLRGGDIDLLVELAQPGSAEREIGIRLGTRIERRIGLRKIDVLVADPATPETAVLAAARRSGVPL
ncbi:MAG: nucleotidyltransferase domain-containing protein [Burkholderiaceae bacterium]|jgi:predicted nucleotidyltransferase|nr:nucleotidyltransferase domain-containing protein [Burkholderiaceae bacterium]MCU0965063.1 nucleotidyltransferase domain-containing protein [Burkholderiaceae bacterium]